MDCGNGPLTLNTFIHRANDNGLQTIGDPQAFMAQDVSSHTVDGGDAASASNDCLTLSINNVSRTTKKPKLEVKVDDPPSSLVDLMK